MVEHLFSKHSVMGLENELFQSYGKGDVRVICISLFIHVKMMTESAYRCLDELHPLLSDALDDSRYVHHSLLLCPLQHMVDGDEGTSAAHTSTAQSTACIVRAD